MKGDNIMLEKCDLYDGYAQDFVKKLEKEIAEIYTNQRWYKSHWRLTDIKKYVKKLEEDKEYYLKRIKKVKQIEDSLAKVSE